MTVAELIKLLKKLDRDDWPVYIYVTDGWSDTFWTGLEKSGVYVNASRGRIEIS